MDDAVYNTEQMIRAYYRYKEAQSFLAALAHVQACMAEDIAEGYHEEAVDEAALCLVDILDQYHEFRRDDAVAAIKANSKQSRKKGKTASNVIKLRPKRKPRADK